MRRQGNICSTCQGPLRKNEQVILAADGEPEYARKYMRFLMNHQARNIIWTTTAARFVTKRFLLRILSHCTMGSPTAISTRLPNSPLVAVAVVKQL
jgi:uncharacterized protein with PIN domain